MLQLSDCEIPVRNKKHRKHDFLETDISLFAVKINCGGEQMCEKLIKCLSDINCRCLVGEDKCCIDSEKWL